MISGPVGYPTHHATILDAVLLIALLIIITESKRFKNVQYGEKI